jgi:hypothetical protein
VIVVVDSDASEKAAEACVPFFEDHLGPEVASRAKRYAPKETGALAASVQFEVDGTTLYVSASGGDDGRTYAAYIELGHRVFHPSTGVVGPEWVPAQPFLRPALYGGSSHLRARMFREDPIMQYRLERLREQERRDKMRKYRDDLHRQLQEITPEQSQKWREMELRRQENYARQQEEDWRTFSRDPVTGEKVFRDEAAEAAKAREARWFAEQWRLAHPGEPREDAPPF